VVAACETSQPVPSFGALHPARGIRWQPTVLVCMLNGFFEVVSSKRRRNLCCVVVLGDQCVVLVQSILASSDLRKLEQRLWRDSAPLANSSCENYR
jgi:hypothetical protein